MKKCKQCLGEVPLKARKCQHCGSKVAVTWKDLSWKERIIGLVGGAVIMFLLISAFSGNGSGTNTSSPDKPASVSMGEEGKLYSGDAEKVFVATNEAALEQSTKSFIADDMQGIQELLLSGKGFVVTSGTRVKVIDTAFGRRKVRILENEMNGKNGWVPMEFVKK